MLRCDRNWQCERLCRWSCCGLLTNEIPTVRVKIKRNKKIYSSVSRSCTLIVNYHCIFAFPIELWIGHTSTALLGMHALAYCRTFDINNSSYLICIMSDIAFWVFVVDSCSFVAQNMRCEWKWERRILNTLHAHVDVNEKTFRLHIFNHRSLVSVTISDWFRKHLKKKKDTHYTIYFIMQKYR